MKLERSHPCMVPSCLHHLCYFESITMLSVPNKKDFPKTPIAIPSPSKWIHLVYKMQIRNYQIHCFIEKCTNRIVPPQLKLFDPTKLI